MSQFNFISLLISSYLPLPHPTWMSPRWRPTLKLPFRRELLLSLGKARRRPHVYFPVWMLELWKAREADAAKQSLCGLLESINRNAHRCWVIWRSFNCKGRELHFLLVNGLNNCFLFLSRSNSWSGEYVEKDVRCYSENSVSEGKVLTEMGYYSWNNLLCKFSPN